MLHTLKRFILQVTFLVGVALIVFSWMKLGTSKTAVISAVAGGVCAVGGAIIGAGIGVATAGVGMSAAVPLALAGASICAWSGPVLVVFGIGRPPAWALPLFIVGWCIVSSVLAVSVYNWAMTRQARKVAPSSPQNKDLK